MRHFFHSSSRFISQVPFLSSVLTRNLLTRNFLTSASAPKPPHEIIIVAGPGIKFGPTYSPITPLQETQAALRNQGAHAIFQIGDGVQPLGKQELNYLYSYLINYSRRPANYSRLTLILLAHGFIDSRNQAHYWVLSEQPRQEKFFNSQQFFSEIAKSLGPKKPIDIFFTPCQGEAALRASHALLPPGSSFTALSSHDEETYGCDILALFTKLQSPALKNYQLLSSEHLLLTYLLNLSSKATPFIYSPIIRLINSINPVTPLKTDHSVKNLSDFLNTQALSSGFTELQIKKIISQLKPFNTRPSEIYTCIEDIRIRHFSMLYPSKKLWERPLAYSNKLDPKDLKNIKDLQAEDPPNYGLALAICFLNQINQARAVNLLSPLFQERPAFPELIEARCL